MRALIIRFATALVGLLVASLVIGTAEWLVYADTWGTEALVGSLALAGLVAIGFWLLSLPVIGLLHLTQARFGLFGPGWLGRLAGSSLVARKSIITIHLGLLTASVLLLPVMTLASGLASTITDADLQSRFIGAVSLLAVLGSFGVGFALAAAIAFIVPIGFLLRYRVSPGVLWLTAFPLPWMAIPLGVVFADSELLGKAAVVLLPVMIPVLGIPLTWFLRPLQPIIKVSAAALLATLTVCLLAFAAFGYFDPGSSGRMPLTSTVLAASKPVTDMDGDGYMATFGGGDCDDLDDSVHPMARDVPGNGIDEDCDGEDAEAAVSTLRLGPAEPYYTDYSRRYNVIWILVDALRADHVSFYGYKRETTPNIDSLASESLVFSNAIAQYPSTGISIPSMLSGRYPEYMYWGKPNRKSQYVLLDDNYLVTDVLNENGYFTHAIVSGWVYKNIEGLGDHFGRFTELYPHEDWKQFVTNSSPVAAAKAIESLEKHRQGNKPFFMYVHFEEPHEPYENHDAPGKIFGKKKKDRYDSDVYWADLWVGFFLEYVRQVGLIEDTIIIVSADHGEEFNDHGMGFHGHQIYQESIHVPLIIRIPGFEQRTVEERVALVDVAPTILDLTGIEGGRLTFQGESLLRIAMEGGDPERPIFSMLADREEKPTNRKKAVLQGNFKLIRDMNTLDEELYDLSVDPREKEDLSEQGLEVMAALGEILTAFLDESDPSWQQY